MIDFLNIQAAPSLHQQAFFDAVDDALSMVEQLVCAPHDVRFFRQVLDRALRHVGDCGGA